MTTGTMTKAEREDLKRLARERARVAKADAARRTADLKASFEEQVVAHYDYDRDEVWDGVLASVKEAMAHANEQIAARAAELGIPGEFSPSVSFTWNRRDPRWQVKQSQEELRRVAYKRLDALERTAKHEIDRAALQVQTQLVAEGLTSDRAIEFMSGMPSVEALMPALDLLELVEGAATSREDTEDLW